MSDSIQELHDPATGSPLEEPLEDNDTSSGILLEQGDYEHSSPDVTSLNSSAILDHPDDHDPNDHSSNNDNSYSSSNNRRSKSTIPLTVPMSRPVASVKSGPSTAPSVLSTEVVQVQDLNQTMPWKLLYPLISRETILSLCKATAINFFLPFINGVFLGFGEICANELAYRWGWTHSAHVVSIPGRRTSENVNAGHVGIRAAGVSGGGSVGSVSGYAGSRSGVGGLGRYEE
ncbi:hypothetical protein BGX28_003812 [Mortierella sp. GBA30]|nr:hypothetical protein BGX28_003812 [Mortierella sp. GBA30]